MDLKFVLFSTHRKTRSGYFSFPKLKIACQRSIDSLLKSVKSHSGGSDSADFSPLKKNCGGKLIK